MLEISTSRLSFDSKKIIKKTRKKERKVVLQELGCTTTNLPTQQT
jgi:hypothetical protein